MLLTLVRASAAARFNVVESCPGRQALRLARDAIAVGV